MKYQRGGHGSGYEAAGYSYSAPEYSYPEDLLGDDATFEKVIDLIADRVLKKQLKDLYMFSDIDSTIKIKIFNKEDVESYIKGVSIKLLSKPHIEYYIWDYYKKYLDKRKRGSSSEWKASDKEKEYVEEVITRLNLEQYSTPESLLNYYKTEFIPKFCSEVNKDGSRIPFCAQFLNDSKINDKSNWVWWQYDNTRVKGKTMRGFINHRLHSSIKNRKRFMEPTNEEKETGKKNLIRTKKNLLRRGAKPKTISMTFGLKKKLAYPENADNVNWNKWGSSIEDPRSVAKGGRKTRKNKK